MTSSKCVMQHAALLLCMLFIGCANATTSAQATMKVSVTFVAPSCSLEVPPTVYLGSIKNGSQSYTPVSFQVNCTTPTKSSVYAEALDGVAPGSTNTVLMKNSGASFWLKDETNNKNITLNGNAGEVFCAGSDSRTCTLTPNTMVTPDNKRGETSTIIRFNIRYDA